jgi:hypothetical protein
LQEFTVGKVYQNISYHYHFDPVKKLFIPDTNVPEYAKKFEHALRQFENAKDPNISRDEIMEYLKYAERAFDESADLHPDDADWKKATSWGYAAVAAKKRGGSYSNYVRWTKQHFKDDEYFYNKRKDIKSALDLTGNAGARTVAFYGFITNLAASPIALLMWGPRKTKAILEEWGEATFESHFKDQDNISADDAVNAVRKQLKKAEAHHMDLKEGVKKFD